MAKYLKPNDTNIDSRKVTLMPDGYRRIQWDICFPDGHIESKSTKSIKEKTAAGVRRKAKKEAEKLLAQYGTQGKWSNGSFISDYINKESLPAIKSSDLRPKSIASYERILKLLADALSGYTIADASRPRVLQKALDDIATNHGTETAKQARKVGNKWLFQMLVLDGVISVNPFRQITVPITVQHVAKEKPKGGIALSEIDYEKAIQYMLALNPADPEKTKPKRGRYTQRQLANKRRNIIDFCLLQATTGLRINEGIELKVDDIDISGSDVVVEVRESVSKTHKGRKIPILNKQVAERIRARVKRSPKNQRWLFPAPTVNKKWERGNAQKAITNFLRDEVSVDCNIPDLTHSHVWRTTLSTIAATKGVPAEIRAAYFGHGEEVNQTYYTDKTDITPFLDAMKE